jgi:uncharacterized protein
LHECTKISNHHYPPSPSLNPRFYDRNLVSNTFTIDQGILEKTLEFTPGEWLLSSYIATGIENVPIFIKADNAENEIESFLANP